MRSACFLQPVEWPRDPAAAVEIYAAGDELAWLDGAVQPSDSGAWLPAGWFDRGAMSWIGVEPIAVLEQPVGGPAELRVGGRLVDSDASGWRLWRRAIGRLGAWPRHAAGPTPGWAGYVGFEAAGLLERLPASHRDSARLPLMRVALFDRAILLDHARRRAIGVEADGLRAALDIRSCDRGGWVERWAQAAGCVSASNSRPPAACRATLARDNYEQMVRRALGYIAAGDIYQVNLAHTFEVLDGGDALAVHARLRALHPAPFAAILRFPAGAVVSASPELFLRLRGREVLTSPIKGTRPRCGDLAIDQHACAELLASPKEAAELTMIVDLHRNDLGRVCEFGSVRVAAARRTEVHPTVFHTVADVRGRLRPGEDALSLLAACFPAGSISGVPKLRALEIIDELEPVARGAYTGTVCHLGLDGDLTANVAIRTLQFHDGSATLHVGGGIVADSDPAAEFEETWAKGRGILGVCGVRPYAGASRDERVLATRT